MSLSFFLSVSLFFFLRYWTDSCRSKWGRRRPFMMFGCIPYAYLLVLTLLGAPDLAAATSSSESIYVCHADSTKFGCRTGWATKTKQVCTPRYGLDSTASGVIRSCHEETVVNRMGCLDEPANETIMSWAAAPVLAVDGFELRARRDHLSGEAAKGSPGATDPLASYVGGDWISISLHVLQYDKKYRGLLLHADDKDGNKVGEWGLPEVGDADFWHPPVCGPKTVLHTGAAIKSLTSRFRFRAPAAGTGTITFKALAKVGPPNAGEFYRPSDLALPEAASGGESDSDNTWIVGPAGATCDEACDQNLTSSNTQQQQHVCDENVMAAGLQTPAATASALSPVYPCNGPLIIDCDVVAPALTTAVAEYRHCWYQDSSVCGVTTVTGREICAANTSASMRRFCACSSAATRLRRQRALRMTDQQRRDEKEEEEKKDRAVEHEAAARRLAVQSEVATSWQKGTGEEDVFDATGWHHDDVWYNPMTGATSSVLYSTPTASDDETTTTTTTSGATEKKKKKNNEQRQDKDHKDKDTVHPVPPTMTKKSGGARHFPGWPTFVALACTLALPALQLVVHVTGRAAAKAARARHSLALLVTTATVLMLLVMPPLAGAHNWIGTPVRGRRGRLPSITTARPCGDRQADDLHYQVGPGQKFVVKFSSGHAGPYSLVVVPGSEYHRLKSADFESQMDDYVQSAPEGNDKAQTPGWRRIRDPACHGSPLAGANCGQRPAYSWFRNSDMDGGRIYRDHPEWIEHPEHPNRESRIFQKKYTENLDRSVAYQSAKYPWFEAAQTYRITKSSPNDYDVIPMMINGHNGAGHYIVHFKWYGFMGCIDIELFDKPVPFPYGKPRNIKHPDYVVESDFKYTFPLNDHCQFDTYKHVLSTCMPAGKNDTGSGVSGVTLCVDMVNRDFATGADDAWAYGKEGSGVDVGPLARCGRLGCNGGGGTLPDIEAGLVPYHYNGLLNAFDLRKIGIQATPMINPDGTFQGVAPHIPWDHPTCAVSSPVLTIDPVQVRRSDALLSAEHMANHPALFGRIDYRENQVCDKTLSALAGVEELVGGVARMPLRKAMSACATLSECGGISVFDPPTPTTDLFATEFNTSALHDVHFCKAATETPSKPGAGVVFLKNATASQQDLAPITPGTSTAANPSYPGGARNDRGVGHEQGLVVGKTIKINFMPNRQPTCEEINHGHVGNLDMKCYWCFRNSTDCGPDFKDKDGHYGFETGPQYAVVEEAAEAWRSIGYLDEMLNTCERCEQSRERGFKEYHWNRRWRPYELPPAYKRHPSINFDIQPVGDILPDDWAIDSGLPFGAREQRPRFDGTTAGDGGPLQYGWNCDVQDDAWFNKYDYLSPDSIMNESFVYRLDSGCASAPDTTKTWTLKLPEGAGLYRVYVYAGRHMPWPGFGGKNGNVNPANDIAQTKGAVHGCTIENVRLGTEWRRNKENGLVGTHGLIEKLVRTDDDLLTFRGGKYCLAINWMVVEKVSKAPHHPTPLMLSQFDPVFLPSSTTDNGILWEAQSSSEPTSESIGFVSFHYAGVKSPSGKDMGWGDWSCQSRWLFGGNWCQTRSPINTGPRFQADGPKGFTLKDLGGYPLVSNIANNAMKYYVHAVKNQPNATGTYTWTEDQDFHGGSYSEAGQGATVSLADTPCDFKDPANPTCPPPKHTCGRITKPTMCPFADSHYCPSVIDCGGVAAKYVRVRLPGKDRVLDTDIQIHRHRPKIDGMVCYAVETREATSTHEISTKTTDMEDPAFYSTCYEREHYSPKWLNCPKSFPPGEFVFGDHCLDCKSVDDSKANKNSGDIQGRRLTRWLPAPRCTDCAEGRPRFNYSSVVPPSPGAGTGTGSDGSGSAAEFWSQDGMIHVAIHYHASDDKQFRFLDFTVTFGAGQGWFAVGVSKTGSMVSASSVNGRDDGGSDVFACDANGMSRYWMTSRNALWVNAGVALNKSPQQDDNDEADQISVNDSPNLASCTFYASENATGNATMSFRRPLAAEDGEDAVQREIKLGETTHFIWAHGSHSNIAYHGGSNRGKRSLIIKEPAAPTDKAKADADKAAAAKAAKDAADKAAATNKAKGGADKAAADKAAKDAANKAAKDAFDKAAASKAIADKFMADKAAADKAAAEKAADKAAADKAAADAKAKADASGSATDIAAADAAKAKADNAAAAAKAAADTASNAAAAAKAAADVASTDRVAAKAAADNAAALGGSDVNGGVVSGGVIAGVVIALLVVVGLVVALYLFRARLTSVVKKGSRGAGPVPKSPAGAAPASWQENTPTIDDPLPSGWAVAVDPGTGATYYYDDTGKTSWTRPDERPKTEIALSPVNMQTNPTFEL